MSDLTGAKAKAEDLLEAARYSNIQIVTEQYSYHTDFESVVIKDWGISLQHPRCQPWLDLEPSELKKPKAEYASELKVLVTKQEIWNDITTYFAIGAKIM